ncbi:hypothetical protein GCM10010909_24590 [Acidocella aquatica]|uniref:HlyD family secretion protein n=1 Tax=Acidocella aquatica TaxID=1922313 RepID=A0ABQ6A814_9PROT|nr:HlyD family secretion protein [Acidocella aquatica]GLR67778.1 hypothetical protein GCM10010909_24590 [Acidocella aquatica]
MSDVTASPPAKRWPFVAAGVIALIAFLAWLVHYLLIGQYLVSTDDAYIAADSSLIAPKISGYVTGVAVRDGQNVHQGDLLVSLDPRDYQIARAAARAAQITAAAQLTLQQAKIAAAQAQIQGDAARLAFAQKNQHRYASLSASGASPEQAREQANSDLTIAQATLSAGQAALEGAITEVDVLKASLAQASAAATQAALDLSHTKITSPFDGTIGAKSVAVGDYLQPGTQIMAVVPLSQVYVIANYKENQITSIQPGQPVSLTVDAFPDLKVTGTVDSIAPASAQEFALLPPDNATGNFTKVIQRVPVKIVLNLTPAAIGALRPGLSVEPTINTRPEP